MPNYNAQFDEQARRDRTRGNRAEETYLDRATGFDARKAAGESAGAMYEEFARKLGRDLQDLRGSQVGMNRLGQGWGFDDEDELVREGRERMGSMIAERALDAEALNLRSNEGLGAYGERTSGRYLDVLAGQRDADMLERERKRRNKGGWLSLGMGALGSLLGPAGSVVGDKIGEGVAGLFD